MGGVGTVVFNPVIDGKTLQTLEFTKVLHVPGLENHLHQLTTDGLYTQWPPIDSHNCAYLSGSIEPLPESANCVFTLPLMPSLWHCHCCQAL